VRNPAGKIIGISKILRDITALKQQQLEREQLITELQKALAEIRTLSGLLPICASCKQVRDDQGYWNQIETYISKHTKAKFSHGSCPSCTVKYYEEAGLEVPENMRAAARLQNRK